MLLWIGRKYIQPLFSNTTGFAITALSLLASIFFGRHVLNHLPAFDFRPYKIGANIAKGMIIPENAAKPVTDYYWKFNVNGEEKIIITPPKICNY